MDQPNFSNPLDKAFVNFKVVESRIEEATSLWMAASFGKVWAIEALFKRNCNINHLAVYEGRGRVRPLYVACLNR
jgi:hypothetical protein